MFFLLSCRRTTCIRKHCRLWSTPSPALHHTTSRSGRRQLRRTATSVKGCCGESRARAWDAQSVGSNVTKSVRSSWMQTACSVSIKSEQTSEQTAEGSPQHVTLARGLHRLNYMIIIPCWSESQITGWLSVFWSAHGLKVLLFTSNKNL